MSSFTQHHAVAGSKLGLQVEDQLPKYRQIF